MDDLLTGFLLGDYEVKQRIGKGGMGVVYLARQVSLDRPVAIKVLPAALCADAEYVDRFLREARAAAHLNHPNLIQIYDAGVSDARADENLYFFVMEYVDGKNLGQIMKEQRRFEERDALFIIQQAAEGLGYAHTMGVVHRDVKPENIMVTNQRAVKIGDLGLAKWKINEYELSLTSSGTTMGTPYYISPEQIRGKDIDGRADVYSLGMTLYHLLAGKPAFGGTSGAEIMAQHLSDKVPPLRVANPAVTQKTMELIAAMTVKKREQRMQDMAEVSDTISEILGVPPSTTTRTRIRKTPRFRLGAEERWHRIWSIGANTITIGIILLLLGVGGVIAWKKTHPPAESPKPPPSIPAKPATPIKEAKKTESPSLVPERPEPSTPKAEPKVAAPKTEPKPIEEAKTPPAPTPVPPPAPEPEKKQTAPEVVYKTKSFSGVRFLQELTISSMDASISPNTLLVARSGFGEFKTLLKPNLIGRDLDSMQLFLKKLEKCSDVTLELTPTFVNAEKGVEISVCRLLVPWGTVWDAGTGDDNTHFGYNSEYSISVTQVNPEHLNRLHVDPDETNWRYASKHHDAKWWVAGASKPGDDYAVHPLLSAADSSPTVRLASDSGEIPVRISILADLKSWVQDNLAHERYTPHPGWIVVVARGEGEIRFASSDDSSRCPRIVFRTPKNSVNP